MRMVALFCMAASLFAACDPQGSAVQVPPTPVSSSVINPQGHTMAARFNAPPGYRRVAAPPNSYTAFLRNLSLHPDGYPVHYYDGQIKQNPNIYTAVLTYDAGTRDLQQCADAVMRIRAEYLFATDQKDQIHFRLTNGFVLDYTHWAAGYRLRTSGNKVQWALAALPSTDYKSFRAYLDIVFTYAGTLSLSKELQPVAYKDLQPGDVLIVGGSPGHAVTVMDVAINAAGKKIYMLSQSYMPAQEIQVLHNPANNTISPWYELDTNARRIITPQWEFTTGQLMRYRQE